MDFQESAKIYLGFFVNGYQPPTQLQKVIDRIFIQSYDRLISFLEQNRHAFLSIYLTRSLGERLPAEFLARIRALYLKQQIEILGGAAYHPLLPLIPEREVKRQLERQREFLKENIIGEDPLPGIFLPELAYSPNLTRIFWECGYQWFIADDHPYALSRSHLPRDEQISMNAIPEVDRCGALLRSRLWSGRIAWGEYSDGRSFATEFITEHKHWKRRLYLYDDNFVKPSYKVIGLDWETFGHWHSDAFERFLGPFFESIERQKDLCQIIPLDSIFSLFRKDPSLGPIPAGSWSTDDLSVPFPLWNHPQNPFNRAWNEFIRITFEIAPENPEPELRELLDKFAYSCSPWQYSQDKKDIASWCLPMFKRIIELLPNRSEKSRLNHLSNELQRLTSVK